MYNFAPASIYMGDTGSLFLGYMISIIALVGFKTTTITSLIIPIIMLFVPILDTLLAMERRLLKGQSVGDADREHLHHQLLKKTKSVTKTVLIMYVINGLFSVVSIMYALGHKRISIILYAILSPIQPPTVIFCKFLYYESALLFNGLLCCFSA